MAVLSENKTTLTNTFISPELFQSLYPNLPKSKVGKGSFTVLDEKVRKSRETTKFACPRSFLDCLSSQVQSMLVDMGAGELVSLKPYKVIFYDKGDFFSEHMDSVHTKGMNMSCVVEFPSECPSSVEMQEDRAHYECPPSVERQEDQEDDEKSNMSQNSDEHTTSALVIDLENAPNYPHDSTVHLFYHDVRHEVEKCDEHRVSITFDIIVKGSEEKVEEEKKQNMDSFIENIKKEGVKRIGFFTEHTYMDEDQDSKEVRNYKGFDHILFSALKSYLKDHEELSLQTEDLRNFYHPTVWDAMNKGPDSLRLMQGYESGNEENGPDNQNRHTYKEKHFTSEFKHKIQEAGNAWEEVFKDYFCLGDVFVIKTWHTKAKVTHKGNDEIYLGNEGFEGVISENLFVLMTL